MIHIHHRPDDTVISEARTFIDAVKETHGHYGECDPAWLLILQRSLGHVPYLLLSRDSHGAVDGYLPIALTSSRLFGRFLVSLPYVTHAGIIARDDDVASLLRNQAVGLADELDVDHLALRNSAPCGDERFAESRTDKIRMTRPLPPSPDDLWQELGPKVRNQIRKGQRQRFTIRFSGSDSLDRFYDVHAENMRNLGSPVYPQRFFSQLLDAFPIDAEIAVVEREGRAAASAILIHGVHGRHSQPATTIPAASCRRVERRTNANMWMYHQLMLRAMTRGSVEFDFGRSTHDSGPYRFKRQWGCQPVSTCWEYYLRRGEVGALRADDSRHARRIAVWKQLPLWVTRVVGPRIVRGIP